jgi:hypothetical protein
MIRNYRPLIHGIIDALLFLESAGPNEVDPDSAVRCMENIASSLLTLEQSDQLALRLEMEKIAEEGRYSREFVRGLPDSIDLASP